MSDVRLFLRLWAHVRGFEAYAKIIKSCEANFEVMGTCKGGWKLMGQLTSYFR